MEGGLTATRMNGMRRKEGEGGRGREREGEGGRGKEREGEGGRGRER